MGNHVFVSKFSAVEDLLYPVIVEVGWWRRHLVQIDVLSNELHFSLNGAPGFFLLLLLGEDPPKLCLLLKALPETPPPFFLPGMLVPYKDAFDITLSNVLLPTPTMTSHLNSPWIFSRFTPPCIPLVSWRTRHWARGWTTCLPRVGL
ncbi:hypothetical protein DSO57_1013563 [Entomophthora muscae]|uniref:Uncharacterized protein n=1 Tax=Entomophthora muscae TaxID=34485 RepID=A0ACC2RKC1_9FUNG|nr:hypothetical protein DSO57_1013563 [Entomophthora muscae]